MELPPKLLGASILLALIQLNFAWSQTTSSTDSLSKLLELHPEEDTVRADRLNRLAYAYWNISPDKTASYAREALALAQQLGYNKGMASAHHKISIAHWVQGQYDLAFEAVTKSFRIYEGLNHTNGMARTCQMMGLIKDDQEQYGDAIRYHERALELYNAGGDSTQIAIQLNNMGAVYYGLKNYDTALQYLDRALAMRRMIKNNYGIAETMDNMGKIYRLQGKYDVASDYLHGALEIRRGLNDINGLSLSLEGVGNLNVSQKRFQRAETNFIEALALANKLDNKKRKKELYISLRDLEIARGNHAKALDYFEQYVAVKDSMLNAEMAGRIAELETQYETEKKEKEIAVLQGQAVTRQLWRNIFGVSAGVAILFAFMIFRFYRYRSEKNRQLYEAQQAQTRQLQEIDRMKSRFFANISHEFRTPLTLILGPIASLIHKQDQKGQQTLLMMQRNARRLLKLINQLLDLSKIESGKLQLHASPGKIVSFARGIVMSFESLADQKGILLRFNASEDDMVVYYEPDKIEQVLTNLLSNAFKFTDKDGKISVSVKRMTRDEKEFLQIRVKDTGIGISQDELPYIFDRFFQADSSDTKEHEGTGIGLSLVKEFVKLHGGEARVESEKNRGTTFRIFLPFGKEHLREEDIATFSPTTSAEKNLEAEISIQVVDDVHQKDGGDGKPSILIVEDNADLRAYIRSSLDETYHIVEAIDGKDGLKKATELTPDLVISDVMMPKVNGIELCRRLKNDERTSHIPVILLTAKTSEEDKLAGLESLADDYLGKPFQVRELMARTKNLIAIRKSLQGRFRGSVVVKPKDIEVSSMDQVFLEKLLAALEENLEDEDFGVEELSANLAMSRVHLHRKLQSLTNHTPSQFIRRFRLQRAMDLLKKNAGTVSEIAYSVGFSSPTYFSKCFVEEYGYPPREVKSQNSNDT
jgi:signal transduction histidine kinase/DNA-binding response OmpR family regulator